jgi:RNA polymerase sigma-70 factor, ECF subfamily
MGYAQALALQRFGLARKGTGVMTELAADPSAGGISEAVTPRAHEQEWETLIHRMAHGDQQALGTFYDATSAQVYGLAWRILSNAAAADTTLVPEQREVLTLAYFSRLSHGDIAARLGLPLGTVKTRIRLGIARLRELLHPLVESL